MKRFILGILILISVALTGCRLENPNPEILDKIYLSVRDQTNQTESKLEAERKALEDFQKAFEKTDPLTHERMVASKDLLASKKKVSSLEQELAYLKIRLKRREVEDRISYKKAFREGKDWPDPAEYEAYVTNQRLLMASKSWDAHIPKLDDRIRAVWDKKNESTQREPAKESKSE